MNDSDLSLSNEFSMEELRASLKKSTSDLVAAANSKALETKEPSHNADEGAASSSSEVEEVTSLRGEQTCNLDNTAIDYETLDVSDEIKELFHHIDAYEPIDLELETPLKCFVPPYILAVGEIDPMIKIPRPDGLYDGIGITRLDEVIASEQSNAAVVELQLKNWSKSKRLQRAVVRSIQGVAGNSHEIDEWIQSVVEIHDSKPQVFTDHNDAATVKEVFEPWPKEMNEKLAESNLQLPGPDIDLSTSEYARVLCTLIGIPTRDISLVKSVNTMFKIYLELSENGSFN